VGSSDAGYHGAGVSPESFIDYWRRLYGETPLIGHALRNRFPTRWLRIHSLPESKRYAETEDERREILRRQNVLFSDLVGDGHPCELVFGYFGEENRLPENVRAALRGLQPEALTTIGPDDSPLLKASIIWRPNACDVVLLAVADDVLETPLIVSTERSCILAPYDGGVDVIVESASLRSQLELRYASWLSRHPAGL